MILSVPRFLNDSRLVSPRIAAQFPTCTRYVESCSLDGRQIRKKGPSAHLLAFFGLEVPNNPPGDENIVLPAFSRIRI